MEILLNSSSSGIHGVILLGKEIGVHTLKHGTTILENWLTIKILIKMMGSSGWALMTWKTIITEFKFQKLTIRLHSVVSPRITKMTNSLYGK